MRGHSALLCGVIGFSLVSSVMCAGCNALDFVGLATAKTTLSEDFKTGKTPQIVVETFNGSIDVSQGKDSEVVVDVTKRARGFDQQAAEANLDSVEVTMIQKDDSIHITAKRIGPPQIDCGADIVIAAPVGSRLQLRSTNGHVVCEGLQGGIEATTSNGKLEVVDGRGSIDVATSNGAITVEAVDASIDAETSNGPVQFRGSLANGENRLRTSNGRIDVALPKDASFRVEGATSNGRIQCEFPLAVEGRSRRNRLEGQIGENAACSLVLSTSNGGIKLRYAEKND